MKVSVKDIHWTGIGGGLIFSENTSTFFDDVFDGPNEIKPQGVPLYTNSDVKYSSYNNTAMEID